MAYSLFSSIYSYSRSLAMASVALALLLLPAAVSAHAVVKPHQVPTQAYQDFTLSIPSEKDSPTLKVRLVIPDGLTRVTPFVKEGWNVQMEQEGTTTTAIVWSSGVIPAGQKDIFQFTAVTPAENTTLPWKVYQTYGDGTVVAWDNDPEVPGPDGKVTTPYSTTEVSTDVLPLDLPAQKQKPDQRPFVLSAAALALSIIAFGASLRRR